MKGNRGKTWKTGLLTGLLLLLTGCFFRSADQLYAVPQPPKDYEALQAQLSAVIAQGGEYAAPLSGDLIQSVQLQDLNGDGMSEAIAFFRFPNDEKPMKIYIFQQAGEQYETMAVIEGACTAVNCIDYVQMNESPYRELVVSWQMGDIQTLAAYGVEQNHVEELLRTDYSSYKLADLDRDNQQELVVFRNPSEAAPCAEYYDLRDTVLCKTDTVPLSNRISGVADIRVASGLLMDRTPAVFAVSSYGEDSSIPGSITDIFAFRNGHLENITWNPETGESSETIRFYLQVGGSDINGDGILELPQAVPLTDYAITTSGVNFWLLHWRQFDLEGKPHFVFTTYHNDRDGWYFILPENWEGHLSLSRADVPGGGARAVIFSYWDQENSTAPLPFLSIYKFTGTNRAAQATSGKRFVLFPLTENLEEASTIYAAEFLEGWDCGLDEQQVQEHFALIKTDWALGS